MMFECFIEGEGMPFFSYGKSRRIAQSRAEKFLEEYSLPIEGLILKKLIRPKRKKQKKIAMATTAP